MCKTDFMKSKEARRVYKKGISDFDWTVRKQVNKDEKSHL